MNNKRYDRLKQALSEVDVNEADSLAELDSQLSQLPSVTGRDSHKRQVITMMIAELPQPKSRWQQVLEWYPVALLLSQTRIIQRELWAASATVLILGVILTITSSHASLNWFSVAAPIVAAASVAVIYDEDVRAMLEIEETTLASARLILLARITLVFCFNLILAFIGSVILTFFDSETLLVPLIMSWLAPMTFLAGFAFFLSIVARDTLFAAGTSLVMWIGHLIMSETTFSNLWLTLISMPGLTDPANRPNLLIGGVILTAVSLWMVGIIDRRAGQIA